MEVSRRSFLKRGLLLGGGAASGLAGAAAHAAGGSKKPYKLTSVNETTNICCYCETANSSILKATRIIRSTLVACARRAPPCGAFATS